jgi:hypothetical protein
MDGISERKKYEAWMKELAEKKPDYLLVETKSPVMKTHWKQIADLKKRFPNLRLI